MANFPKFCTACGAPLKEGSKFCTECGTKVLIVEEEAPKIEEPIQEEKVDEAPIIEAKPEVNEAPIPEEIKEEPQPVVEEPVQEEPQPVVEEPKEEQPQVIENKPAEELKAEEPKPEEEKPEEPKPEEPKEEEESSEQPKGEGDPEELKKKSFDSGVAAATATGAYLGYVFGKQMKKKSNVPEPTPEDLLEPRKKYLNELKEKHNANANKFFDDLVEKSGVNAEENRETMRQYHKYESEKRHHEYISNYKSNSKLLGIFGPLCLMFGAFGLTLTITLKAVDVDDGEGVFSQYFLLFLVLSIVILCGGIAMMIINSIRRKRIKKALQPKIDACAKKMQELEGIARSQMAPLNDLFDFNILNNLSEKTAPLIQLDDHPDSEKIDMLINKYGWNQNNDKKHSALYLKTGDILGNPFVLYSGRYQTMQNHTYTGSLTITWTKKVTIGKTTTYIPMTEVLTASVTKPKPFYGHEIYLAYGNEAAPHLTFSRTPMVHKYDEKSLKKLFKEREKVVDEYAKKHPSFTPLGNDEFEDFFDGTNRDNEVEYRLLFTPLAQKSILDLITNPDPVGDYFSFYKNKMINRIYAPSSTNVELEGDPRVFQGFDIDEMKNRFVKTNNEFFRYIYFQLAPLLSIPIYQQHKPHEYIYKGISSNAYSGFVLEMLSNKFYDKYFQHEACHTQQILKSEERRVNDNSIQCLIHSYGYTSVAHTEYFSKLGGDGYFHNVPVTWYEYIPVEKVTPFVAHETFISKQDYSAIASEEQYRSVYNQVKDGGFYFNRGYFTFVKNSNAPYDPSPLNALIKKRMERE